MTLSALAQTLFEADSRATAIPQLGELSLEDAYAVQRLVVDLRNEPRTGVKLGFTSRAKAVQMGVSDLIIGQLTSGMAVADGGTLDHSRFIHPRVEPEVAFLVSEGQVVGVAPALEIIDSRYQDFRFNLADVVADNTSAAAYVLGPWQQPGVEIGDLGVVLEVDGAVAQTGSTAAILGDPMRALDAVTRLSQAFDIPVPSQSVVLAGAATAAVALPPGSFVEARIAGLGRVTVTS
ncbi:fumarylacetoacetate hydrolase family protein [Actinocrispum sp. NPDC049592]|uniref:2-keto-4-pentenoate hydratase n=1 Tax=Actinocrispum sp. NPDC049592 TaxID=3154835 RepID=UPI00342E0669